MLPKAMAFDREGYPYVLYNQKQKTWIAEIGPRNKVVPLRQVGNKDFFFQIHVDSQGQRYALQMSNKVKVYPLDSSARGRTLLPPGETRIVPMNLLSMAPCGPSLVVGGSGTAYEYRDGAFIKADAKVTLFAVREDCVARWGKTGWEKWCDRRYDRGFQGIAYSEAQKKVVLIYNLYIEGREPRAEIFSRNKKPTYVDGGYYAVCCGDRDIYVYSFGEGLLKLGKKTTKVKVEGEVTRNECLYSDGKALWFLAKNQLQVLRGQKWTRLNLLEAVEEVSATEQKPPSKNRQATTKFSQTRVAATKVYLEYADGKTSKFWQIEINGSTQTVRYGRIGSNGQTKTKEYDSASEAKAEAEKLVSAKVKKGYVPGKASAGKSSAKVPTKETSAKKTAAKKTSAKKTTAKKTTAKKALVSKSGAAIKKALSALIDDIVELCEGEYERREVESLVQVSSPVSPSEVKTAAAKLKATLPPSYVDLVTTNGAFTIDGTVFGRGSGNDSKLLTPREMAERTQRYRDDLEGTDDDESKQILNDGLLFYGHPMGEAFYLFVLSSRKKNDEMSVHDYDYQDPGNSEVWEPSFGYEPFAKWLLQQLEEAREAAAENIDDIMEELQDRR